MAVGIQEPLLKQEGSTEEKDKPFDKTCPASGEVGKKCAIRISSCQKGLSSYIQEDSTT